METKAYSYIRFSTPEQLKGDSLRRQLEASRQYAKEHNLSLDENMQDLGLSAFKGINRLKGAFGKFLQLVEAGKIERGSILIVENLDRLSRQEVLEALNVFTSIIQAGISIVTLQDGMKYSKESITDNWAQLIISITYMARAFDESKRKSQRVSASWVNKRRGAINGERVLTTNIPYWLKVSDDKKSFKVIEERGNIISMIYEMKLEGKGSEKIAKILNKTNLWKPPAREGKPPSWSASYIDKLLHGDRRLIGEFQPCLKIDGKPVKTGDPIKGYYPSVISLEKFNFVQALIEQNKKIKGNAGGRDGRMNNLFGHLAKCSYCGYSMLYRKISDSLSYLECEKSKRRGMVCKGSRIRYDLIEESVLTYCKGLNVADVIGSNTETMTELSQLQHKLHSIEVELTDTNKKYKSILDSMEITKNLIIKKDLDSRATELITLREKLESEKKEIHILIDKLLSNSKNTEEQLKSVKELIDLMKALAGQERVNIRLSLRTQLRRLITKIEILDSAVLIHFQSGTNRFISFGKPKGKRVIVQEWENE
jgi:DNA invertase Pin-like site-specific DNA recombinase